MLSEGSTSYAYDLKNNLKSVTKSGMTSNYAFNGLGQRVFKSSNGTNTYFLYDDATNLIGEYSDNGDPIIEHIYLNGVPIGVVQNHNIYYVHTDQLGTPRAITDGGNSIVWKWSNTNPFGKNLPSIQNIIYNKRFAGQYFDNESNLHYNYYRTYNPLIGRYIQSDPIGLAAGFNTYNYVEGNPLGATDSLGLQASTFMTYGLVDSGTGYFPRIGFEGEERAKKLWAKTHPNIILFVSHGSPGSMNKFSPVQVFNQMRYGVFQTQYGFVKNKIFKNFIEEDKDINIILDACNVASDYWYEEGKSGSGKWAKKENFVNGFGNNIRNYLNSIGKGHLKVNLMAASGFTSWKVGSTNPLEDRLTPMEKEIGGSIYKSKNQWDIYSF